MSCCEKCWADAQKMYGNNTSKSIHEHYVGLLEVRKNNPCSPKEQAGMFWDEEKQCDSRANKNEPEVECCNCGWQGLQTDLRNPMAYGDDIFIDGEYCPECESKEIGDI